jgi:glc operon protein GlcG
MKIRIALMAAIAAVTLGGTGMAASLSDVVQKGEWADRIKEKNQLNIATAERIAKHCVEAARAKNLGVSIAIVDQFGVIIYYYRADGQGKTNTETALMKAKTVLNTRQPSKAQMNAVRSGNTSEARVISFGNFANAGALPIVVEGQFLGAIGVGGMAPTPGVWSDEICAHNALTAVIGPQPALLPDLPNPFVVTNPPSGQRAAAQ